MKKISLYVFATLTLWISVWAFVGSFLPIINPYKTTEFGGLYNFCLMIMFPLFMIFSYAIYKININIESSYQQQADKWFSSINLLVTITFLLNIVSAFLSRVDIIERMNTPFNIFFSTNELPSFPEETLALILSGVVFSVVLYALFTYFISLLKGKNILFRKAVLITLIVIVGFVTFYPS